MPEFNTQTVFGGSFTSDFEKYTTDTFMFRDGFREIKALMNYEVFNKKENNEIIIHDGSMIKLEKELDEASISHAMKRFEWIYNKQQ